MTTSIETTTASPLIHKRTDVPETNVQELIDTESPRSHTGSYHFNFPCACIHDMARESKSHPQNATWISEPWVPPTDIRETLNAYQIEIELPGVDDRESVALQWLSPKTLVAQGFIERPLLAFGGHKAGNATWKQCEKWSASTTIPRIPTGDNENDFDRVDTPKSEISIQTRMLLSGRNIGPWYRSFTLPNDADIDDMRTKLESGLLRLHVPRKEMSKQPRAEITID